MIRCRCGGRVIRVSRWENRLPDMWRCERCHQLVARLQSIEDAMREATSGPVDPEFGVVGHAQPPGVM